MRVAIVILLVMVISFSLFMIFYGGYYLINPDMQGEEILAALNIPYPTVIAHRGSSIVAPESTRPAYIKAREVGADYLEADLQRTKDGEIVIFHDDNLERTSNVEEVFPDRKEAEIGEFTYDELKELDFGSWFNRLNPDYAREEYQGLEIIKLEDLISIAKSGDHTPGLILETKAPEKYPGIEAETVDILAEEGWLELDESKDKALTILFSFSEDSVREFKDLAPDIPRILLITDNMITRRSWRHWLDKADDLADGLGTKGFMNWPWHIAAAHDKGMFVFPYTINELWQMKVLGRFQSSGYITDRPDVVLEFLDRVSELPELPEFDND